MADDPKIVNMNDLEWKDATYSEHYTGWSKRLTPSMDRKQGHLGVVVERLKPKSLSCPFHYHVHEDEFCLILSGKAMLRYGDKTIEVKEGDLVLFESGAIVFHIAERHAGLLPNDANARARAIAWMFAALSTVEPVIVQREVSLYLERDKTWHEERLSIVEDRIRSKLDDLSARLGAGEWLDGAFSAGDLLMVQVLRRLSGSGILDDYPNLVAYVARSEARPAFKRAFDAQLAVVTGKPSQYVIAQE